MHYTIDTAHADDTIVIAQFQLDMALETENMSLDLCTVTKGVNAVIDDDSKGFYIVARDEKGCAVGSLLVTTEWSDWRCKWYWWIQSVYVKPEHRGKGVFKMLYETVIQRAREQNVSEVRLYVEHTNTIAQQTYSKLGMTQSHYLMYEKRM